MGFPRRRKHYWHAGILCKVDREPTVRERPMNTIGGEQITLFYTFCGSIVKLLSNSVGGREVALGLMPPHAPTLNF